MATIKTPAAGVSPYQESAVAPTVLTTTVNGRTASVLSASATAATATAAAATASDTSVTINGQEALNRVITTSRTGVFEGANVTINLEEQLFSTTNQVTSSTNYPSGNIGEIQYNSGSNSFASSAYFTYTNGNVVTPGIRTDGYFYSNGSPFTGGGNAAIGNFVFTGDTMSISDDANASLTIQGNSLGNNLNQIIINPTSVDLYAFNTNPYSYAELYLDNSNTEEPVAQIIVDGNSTPTQIWTFAADGNLTLPSNTFAVNYANGSPVVISGGAAGLPLANGTSNINIATANGNVTITANGSPTWTFKSDGNLSLPTAGNILGAVNIIGNGTGNVNVEANGRAWTFAADGNLVLPLAGNIVNYGNTWNFGYNGTTQFPANVIQAPAGSPITVRATIGNSSSRFGAGDNFAQIGLQDDTTGAYQAWAYVETDMANVNTPSAVVIIKPGDTGTEVRWNFDALGNLTLPANIIAINYANGNRVTGNITFSSEIVIGTGTSNLISGLYLAPSSSSANANMYLRVRGNINDEPTHIHFDTGNNAYYNQFIGDDNKYIQLANTGNIVINSNDVAGNSAQWTFAADGNLIFPTGNLVIIPDYASESNAAVISSTDHILALLSTGVNGGVQSVWTEDIGNIGTSNTAAVRVSPISQIGNVQIQTGNNSSINTWNFGTNSILTLPGNSRVAPVGANIEIQAAAGGYAEIVTSDGNSYVAVTTGGAEIVTSGIYTWTFGNTGNLTTPGASGNITGANVIIANILSAIGDVESSNVNAATLSAIGNVVANNAIITQVISGATLELVNTANVGNLSTVGSVSASGNITSRSAIYAGNGATWQTQVALANVVFVGAEVADTYIQAAMIETSGNGSADWVSYSNNGNADSGWIDMGMTGNTFNDPDYELTDPNDGYILVQGTNFAATPLGGNLVLATGNIGLAHDIVFATGGFTHANIKAKLFDATGEFSVVGNIAGNYFIGNGSQLTDVGAASVPGQNILPTIQTITVAATSGVGNAGGGGSAFANVTVSNVTPVTEYGVIITAGTSSQKYATGALGSIPGTVKLSFTTGLNSTPFTVYAYVTSNAGTYYSNAATGTSGICLLAGTHIALSDGTHKAIEYITYTDKLLSWDFDRGCYAETTALWIKRSETGSQYNLLTFSDGTTLRTFDQHRIFNKQAGAFTYPMTAATPIGTVTVNEHGQEITLTNKQVIKDTIEYYNVITDYHMNLFSDSVLTSCRFNNIYPITDMKFTKDGRTLRTRAEFENVPDRFFHGLRLAEQTADIETVEWYVDRLLATEVSTQSELAF